MVWIDVWVDGVDAANLVPWVERSVKAAVTAAWEAAAAYSSSDEVTLEVSVLLTGDDRIRTINREQRGLDAPTDVLAFPQWTGEELEELRRGKRPKGFPPLPVPLGDLLINVEEAQRAARRRRRPVEDEVCLLAVHGCLHLLGFDHDHQAASARMNEVAGRALSAMGLAIRHEV